MVCNVAPCPLQMISSSSPFYRSANFNFIIGAGRRSVEGILLFSPTHLLKSILPATCFADFVTTGDPDEDKTSPIAALKARGFNILSLLTSFSNINIFRGGKVKVGMLSERKFKCELAGKLFINENNSFRQRNVLQKENSMDIRKKYGCSSGPQKCERPPLGLRKK